MRGMLEDLLNERSCANLYELQLISVKLKINKRWMIISLVFMIGILLAYISTGLAVVAFIWIFVVMATFFLALNRLQLLGRRKSLQK